MLKIARVCSWVSCGTQDALEPGGGRRGRGTPERRKPTFHHASQDSYLFYLVIVQQQSSILSRWSFELSLWFPPLSIIKR